MLLFWGHEVPDFLTFLWVEWFKQPTTKAAAGVTLCPGAACPAASECTSRWRHGQSVAKSGLYRSCTTTSHFAPVPFPLCSCAGDGWWCLQGTWTCHLHVPERRFSVGYSSMALPGSCPWVLMSMLNSDLKVLKGTATQHLSFLKKAPLIFSLWSFTQVDLHPYNNTHVLTTKSKVPREKFPLQSIFWDKDLGVISLFRKLS